ncbi:MAG: LysR family transcriptional regulator [Eubacteriales bacterium]|nr:LysR family transcriptional regulator [Eubacteriales bacterium]
MNFNQLEYFIQVAECLNFTRAAEKCFISQTAMTQQIRALEKQIGVPLFLRDKHHVELTPAGRVYLNEARQIVAHGRDALRLARLASDGVEGEVTIGFVSGYGQSDFTEPLGDFHRTYPKIKINLIRGNMSVLLETLSRGECDLVMSIAPFKREYPDLEHRYYKSYPVMAVLPGDHALVRKKKITYQDLKQEKFLMMEPVDRPKDQMEESLLIYERGGYLPDVIGVEGDPETLFLMISLGLGVSIIPEYITRSYQKDLSLGILPVVQMDGTTETVDVEACWRAENPNPAVKHLLEVLF